ncbi:hypothetical protein [Faecalibacter rhinopitheci]|uniref:Uncharacterized protein n=1 Tax=Faecalibacter rhinopitheci TaxID=2779678 RepID=A0A8J7FZ33_9FLAO|nr:hypothetical protein [Faecalibacter rhinopitheci]MBF0598293.1 hypothetical protein [Faecalibacter rhinopitheci]
MKNKLINVDELEFIESNKQQYILGGYITPNIEPLEEVLRTIYYPDNTI